MLLFDTAAVPVRDRADALDAALNSAVMPQSFAFASGRILRHQTEFWQLGPGVQLMRSTGAGLDIARTARHVRRGAPEIIVLGLPTRTPSLFTAHDDVQTLYEPGTIHLHDTTRPYWFRQSELSRHTSLLIEPARLSLPVDLVRAAGPRLRSSSVHDLLRAHMIGMCDLSPEPDPQTMAVLGRVTADLVWALITSAAEDPGQREALTATLATRITMYIDAHLHQTGLNATRIAAAHGISVRQLYRVWAGSGHELSLSAWILRGRLEGARDRLADPAVTETVAATAHACGFTNLAHFSTRFREAFGISPREWRRLGSATSAGTEAAAGWG